MESALHVRLAGHQSDIKHRQIEKPVAEHFALLDHFLEYLTIMSIEVIHREDAKHQKRKESHLIEMIQLLMLDGLNLNPYNHASACLWSCASIWSMYRSEGT